MPTGETLNLRMYDFLIKPIRHEDQLKGNRFVQRFLEGGQNEWADTQANIFRLKDLWSVTDCPDEILQYLKRIVGWTPDLDHITDQLDYDALRRLISTSVALWKSRTTENSIIDVLNVIVPTRSRVWNWFDFVWITGETVLTEERRGRDPWLISMPDGNEEHWSNVRVVDPGVDKRQLVIDTLKLMRPLGERYLVTYLKALDLFDVVGDFGQWDTIAGPSPIVEDGELKLNDNSFTQFIALNIEDSENWDSYIFYARIKGSYPLSPIDQEGFGILFYFDPSSQDGYFASLNVATNKLHFGTLTGGGTLIVTSFDFGTVPYLLQQNVSYGLRVQIIPEGATNRIKIYVDGVERINTTSTHRDEGTVGLMHVDSYISEYDEIEVLGLPVDSETIEINS